jgi:hypothetical protein|tara:strand:+ start:574 stop:939 length:366 start_codon:yes stop_codon:yes gene_type:complete
MNLGEYSESLFTTRCIEMGYIVSKPFSYYTRYDLVVDVNNVLNRVQVKSTEYIRKDNQSQVRVNYDSDEIDWFAVYFKSFNFWYIIPVEAVENIKQLSTTIEGNFKYKLFMNNFGFVRHGF